MPVKMQELAGADVKCQKANVELDKLRLPQFLYFDWPVEIKAIRKLSKIDWKIVRVAMWRYLVNF